jgi:hypothetical protein
MKRHFLPILACLLAASLLPADLAAQDIVPFVGGGIAKGSGDLGDDTSSGWFIIGGVDVTLPSIDPGLGFGPTVTYASIPYNGTFSERAQLTTISGELSYAFGSGHVRPYIRGGAGVQIHKYDPGSINTNSVTSSQAAFTAGAGVGFQTSSAQLTVGARFSTASDGGFLGIHAGVAIPLRASR